MTSNVLCKYYMNGACHFGDQCRFSHNRQDESSQVCKYYLQGNCAYGDKCRYEHSKPSWSSRGQLAAPSNYQAPAAVPKPPLGGADDSDPNWDDYMTPDEMDEFEKWQDEQEQAEAGAPGDEFGEIVDPADLPLCSEFGETGQCSAGEDCLYVHGDMCETCKQHVLHPFNELKAQEHRLMCAKLAASIAKRKKDAMIECGICYEKVLSKREPSQRRFGLMACDHAFCLGCIRNWRSTAEVDKTTALRTCPICRTPTYFITPSSKWPDCVQEKDATIEGYKAAMAQKDCTHFAYGEGTCPFGTSCFYRHAYRDGRLEEVQLRRAANEEGDVKVLAPVKLSSFLEASIAAQRALARRPLRREQQQQRQQLLQRAGVQVTAGSAAAADERPTAEEQQQLHQSGRTPLQANAGSSAAAAQAQTTAEQQQQAEQAQGQPVMSAVALQARAH